MCLAGAYQSGDSPVECGDPRRRGLPSGFTGSGSITSPMYGEGYMQWACFTAQTAGEKDWIFTWHNGNSQPALSLLLE